MLSDIFFLIFTLIAEIVGTVGGFGSSVLFVPIAANFFDFQTVLGITAVFHIFSNVSKILLFRSGLDKKLLLQIGIPSVLFVIIGGLLSKYFEGTLLETILGIFLIVLSLVFILFPSLSIRPGRVETITGGGLSGFSAGLLGTGGAIRGLTMASFNLKKEIFIATSAAIDLAVDLSRGVVYTYNGYIDKQIWVYIPFLLIIGYLGSWIGKKMLHYIPQTTFRKIALYMILTVGIYTLYKVISV